MSTQPEVHAVVTPRICSAEIESRPNDESISVSITPHPMTLRPCISHSSFSFLRCCLALRRWVAEEEWSFETAFQLSSHFMDHEAIALELSCIDTVADVHINHHVVSSVRNMHRPHVIKLDKADLSVGHNSLSIAILPAAQAARQAASRYPYKVPAMAAPGQLPHWNFIRKPGSDFGWDWGPAFAPSGGLALWLDIPL